MVPVFSRASVCPPATPRKRIRMGRAFLTTNGVFMPTPPSRAALGAGPRQFFQLIFPLGSVDLPHRCNHEQPAAKINCVDCRLVSGLLSQVLWPQWTGHRSLGEVHSLATRHSTSLRHIAASPDQRQSLESCLSSATARQAFTSPLP